MPPSRFTFGRVEGWIPCGRQRRPDKSYCSTTDRGWARQAASENHPALEGQVAGLQDDVTALKKLEAEIARAAGRRASVKKLKAEIVRLRDEMSSLKKEIVALKEPPLRVRRQILRRRLTKVPMSQSNCRHAEDMARASAFIEKTWRRLVDMINTVQKDMMRKG